MQWSKSELYDSSESKESVEVFGDIFKAAPMEHSVIQSVLSNLLAEIIEQVNPLRSPSFQMGSSRLNLCLLGTNLKTSVVIVE
ncbi:hypothetical protein ACH5RR_013128 [Cinchona calisaya]|uniref:Uncharacterized protein n=1 Tax=Cinchona calisaya TaxID=153742 RepID=A0ABD3A1C6_9GENT